MAKLSIIIPSRDEQFLVPTIDDIFAHAAGEVEVVAVIDSDKWPAGWKEVTERHANLHTIHNGQSLGMRQAINRGVASAISRGATYIAKSDAHCSFSEGFDEILKAEMDDDWIVVPRRLRLDPESWTIAEPDKPPYDYHYLSFPDDPNDFGGPGLNGKPWAERAIQRADIPVDEEMSSQGSFWAMKADYFNRLELMDHANYGPFWNEFQEIGLKCWLSGGKVMVNKKCHYLHLHKGKKYGRGYRLQESALTQGRNHTMKWLYNEAWAGQTLPFSWLIEHFAPVPGWPEDWERRVYTERPPRLIGTPKQQLEQVSSRPEIKALNTGATGLEIHSARYGVDADTWMDVTHRVRELVRNNSLDIVVNNATLTPDHNPYRGKKKRLSLSYSYNGGGRVLIQRSEKDWLIIGQVQQPKPQPIMADDHQSTVARAEAGISIVPAAKGEPMSVTALNDYLIRKFSVSAYRLRAPMPIELPHFHRDDLAQLFAELGFRKGCEIGVAEGTYSEVLLKANPDLELLLVDPWHRYSDNPQGKSAEKHESSYRETLRKTKGYNVRIVKDYSMNAVREIPPRSLQFVYIDGMHSYDYVMSDLIEWSRRVVNGGIVALDDFYYIDRKRWGAGVVEAVQSYTLAHDISPWFICQGHKSVEAFWVNP